MLLCIIYVFILYVSLLYSLTIRTNYKYIYHQLCFITIVCAKKDYILQKKTIFYYYSTSKIILKNRYWISIISNTCLSIIFIYIDRFYHNIIAKKNSPLSHLMTCLALYLSSTAITLRSPKPCSCFSSFLVIIYPSSVICGSYL